VAYTAGCRLVAVDLDRALHCKVNEVLSLVPKIAEHCHNVVQPLGPPLDGLALSASDHSFGVVSPQHAETVVVGVDCGISEAGGRVADSRLV
jgi:hypothetical protein